MTDNRSSEDPGAVPSFAFLWFVESRHGDATAAEMLLIWPVAERRPPGAFARFIVLEDDFGRAPLIVPMDLQSGDANVLGHDADAAFVEAHPGTPFGTRVREDVGSLPALVRLPAWRSFTLTMNYLVRRTAAGVTRVEVVATPPVRFAELNRREVNRWVLVGLVGGGGSPGPGRPIVATVNETAEGGGPGADTAPTFVEIADEVFRAHERATAMAGRRTKIACIFAAPVAEDATIGRAQTVVPYKGAMIRVSAETLRQAADDEADPGTDQLCRPSLRCVIGTSQANRDALDPCIVFFHWNRAIASLRSREGPHGASASEEEILFYRGKANGPDLSFVFAAAGFGDVVGVMVGPRERVAAFFPDRPGDTQLLEDRSNWTVAPFLWTGDEMVPFYLLEHQDAGNVRAAVDADLDYAARHLPLPPDAHFLGNFADYLLPRSRALAPALGRCIQGALRSIAGATRRDEDILALDPYCELLDELNAQIVSQAPADEWRRLEEMFSFPEFIRLPQLHRALVLDPGLRRSVGHGFALHRTTMDDVDVLTVVLRMVGTHEPEDWVAELRTVGLFVAWEVVRRAPGLVKELIALGIEPDLVLLADCFGDRAVARVQVYRGCSPTRLLQAAEAHDASGDRDRAAFLTEVAHHRERPARGLIPYERLVAALDLVAAT